MIGMTVRRQYLNPRFVIEATRRAKKRVLSRQGAYVRGIAKRKIRRRKNPKLASAPGQPPYTHTGALKKSIVFAVGTESVIIGPTYSEIGRIGHTHEFGGTEPKKVSRQRRNNWNLSIGGHGPVAVKNGRPVIAKLQTARQVERAKRIAREIPAGMTVAKPRRTYPKRPYMGPALADARPALPAFWRDSIRSTG